jgi:hypothetical protein
MLGVGGMAKACESAQALAFAYIFGSGAMP